MKYFRSSSSLLRSSKIKPTPFFKFFFCHFVKVNSRSAICWSADDEFDFIYLGGSNWAPEYEDYIVYATDGNVLVDQNIPGQIPQTVSDVVVCQNNSGLTEGIEKTSVKFYPNPATNYIKID